MTTTAAVSSMHELRVQLPALPLALVPDIVAERIANLSRLVQGTAAAVQAVDAAERDVRAAESADDTNRAAALLHGTAEPEAQTPQAEAALKDAQTRLDAHRTASVMARNELAEAAVDHAEEWRERLALSHNYAVARFENAVRDLEAASTELTSTGEVLAMLDVNPASLIIGGYFPSAWLSEAAQTARQAAAEARQRAPKVDA